MEKNFLQDVVPPTQKKSIRNIPIPKGRRRASATTRELPEEAVEERVVETPPTMSDMRPPQEPPKTPEMPEFKIPKRNIRNNGGKMKKITISVLILFAILGVVTIMSIFNGAEVQIYPKQAEATLNEIVTLENIESSETSGSLTYKVIEVSEEKSKKIKATGEEEVQSKASGKIRIFNNYTSSEQPLVKNTRFESPEGLIYRIDKSITVPGKSENGDPGVIEVEVFADDIGEEYNFDSETTFKIPGFEGQPQYDSFSAVSITNFDGGFNGIRQVVSEEDLQSAKQELEEELKASLVSQVDSQISEEFFAIIDGSLYDFSSPKQKEADKNEVEISINGSLKALVVDTGSLSNYLAGESLNTFNPADNVLIEDTSSLNVSVQTESITSNLSSVAAEIEGSVSFIWQTDHDALKNSLVGKPRKAMKDILSDYSSITKIEAKISPFWKRTFPKNSDKIEIIELKEQ